MLVEDRNLRRLVRTGLALDTATEHRGTGSGCQSGERLLVGALLPRGRAAQRRPGRAQLMRSAFADGTDLVLLRHAERRVAGRGATPVGGESSPCHHSSPRGCLAEGDRAGLPDLPGLDQPAWPATASRSKSALEPRSRRPTSSPKAPTMRRSTWCCDMRKELTESGHDEARHPRPQGARLHGIRVRAKRHPRGRPGRPRRRVALWWRTHRSGNGRSGSP